MRLWLTSYYNYGREEGRDIVELLAVLVSLVEVFIGGGGRMVRVVRRSPFERAVGDVYAK